MQQSLQAFWIPVGWGGVGGYTLIWPIQGCAARQGTVFLPLRPKQGI